MLQAKLLVSTTWSACDSRVVNRKLTENCKSGKKCCWI